MERVLVIEHFTGEILMDAPFESHHTDLRRGMHVKHRDEKVAYLIMSSSMDEFPEQRPVIVLVVV